MNDQLLTFELVHDGDSLEIHANQKGLDTLISCLKRLRQTGGDIHLMTETWGGSELSGNIQGKGNILINHVKVMLWNSSAGNRGRR